MNPDKIIRFCNTDDFIRECFIHLDVRIPIPSVMHAVLSEIMEQRPDSSVTETIVVMFNIILPDEYGMAILLS
jgi:hypothetical protein